MAPEREPDGSVVRDDALTLGGGGKQRLPFGGMSGSRTQFEYASHRCHRGTFGTRHLPERQVPVATQGCEGARRGQRFQVAPIQASPLGQVLDAGERPLPAGLDQTLRTRLR